MILFSQPSQIRPPTVRRFFSAVALVLPLQLITGLPSAHACEDLKGTWVDQEFRYQLKPHVHGNNGKIHTGQLELCDARFLRFNYKLKHKQEWKRQGQKYTVYKTTSNVKGDVDIRRRDRDTVNVCADLPKDWGEACVWVGDVARILAGG